MSVIEHDAVAMYVFMVITILFFLAGLYSLYKMKRRNPLSLRSPLITLVGTVNLFFMTLNFSIPRYKYTAVVFYIFEGMYVACIILRYHRILRAIRINPEDTKEQAEHSFTEKKYLKVGLIILLLLIILLVAGDIVYSFPLGLGFLNLNGFSEEMTSNEDHNYADIKLYQLYIWIIVTFIEEVLLITYSCLLVFSRIQSDIKSQSVIVSILFFIFMTYISLIEILNFNTDFDYDYNYTIFIVLILYVITIFDVYYPIYLSISAKQKNDYFYVSELSSNLYLFLTDMNCYGAFSDYLAKDQYGPTYLGLYTKIMEFKMDFQEDSDSEEDKVKDANEVMDMLKSTVAEEEFNQRAKNIIEFNPQINNNTVKSEMFDDVLQYIYKRLGELLDKFKIDSSFSALMENVKVDEYLQCKMKTHGLINKE